MNESARTIVRHFLRPSWGTSIENTVWLCILDVIPRIGTSKAQECTYASLFYFITARRREDATREAEAAAFEQGWAIHQVKVCRAITGRTVPRSLRKQYLFAKREGRSLQTAVHMAKEFQATARTNLAVTDKK